MPIGRPEPARVAGFVASASYPHRPGMLVGPKDAVWFGYCVAARRALHHKRTATPAPTGTGFMQNHKEDLVTKVKVTILAVLTALASLVVVGAPASAADDCRRVYDPAGTYYVDYCVSLQYSSATGPYGVLSIQGGNWWGTSNTRIWTGYVEARTNTGKVAYTENHVDAPDPTQGDRYGASSGLGYCSSAKAYAAFNIKWPSGNQTTAYGDTGYESC